MTDRKWMESAACRNADPAIMFPQTAAAGTAGKKICAVCPVKAACLAYAFTMINEGVRICGLWGGEHAGTLKCRTEGGDGAMSEFVCEHETCSEMVPAARITRGRPQKYCSTYCRRAAGKVRARARYAEKTAE